MDVRPPPADFYADLPREAAFAALTETTRYHAVPQDWFVGVADVVNSTQEVERGRYKTVNMVGAAVISAMMNGHGDSPFPFVFGGDGAGFAVGPDKEAAARQSLGAVAAWAKAEFDIGLRVALVPVLAIREAGQDLRVARFQVSDGADYAMFAGGGLLWAEEQLKAGAFALPPAPPGTVPDLTGLSCRWANMEARQGTILSLVVAAAPEASTTDLAVVYRDIIQIAERLERGGHPAPVAGMTARWPPAGATLEAHAQKGNTGLWRARSKALFEALVAWVLIRTGLTVGGFDARRYARVVAANADYRKLDDGLKMTLDIDVETQAKLEDILQKAAARGTIRYGTATQDAAMMTCIVPSIMSDNHLHFIDGASGGYTKAATMMKRR